MSGHDRAIFLDRDGVINVDTPEFVKSWEEFMFAPDALDGLALLAATPYRVVIVTNQSGVGRGLLTEAVLGEIHTRMRERITAAGGRIDAIYYCPHAPNAGCSCRKPLPGMFLRAAGDLGLDLSRSWAIGDRARDAVAAVAAGVKALVVKRGLAAGTHEGWPCFADLVSAVRVIIENP